MTVIEKTYNWASNLLVRKTTDLLVLHHTAALFASPDDIHKLHLDNGWSGIGYHFYVRKDGSVFRGRPENAVGAHTYGFNSSSIGICFEGNFETECMSDVQIAAGRELITELRSKYMGVSVCAHRDLAATACPGKNFPFDALVGAAIDADIPGEPSDWTAEACDWALSNGIVIGDGSGSIDWKAQVSLERLIVILYRTVSCP